MTTIPDLTVTITVLGFLAALIGGAWKAFAVLDARMTKKADDASTVAVAKAVSVEMKGDRVSDDLAAFRLEVARNYVTTEWSRRLEDRMDKGFTDLRETLLDTLTDRPARRRGSD